MPRRSAGSANLATQSASAGEVGNLSTDRPIAAKPYGLVRKRTGGVGVGTPAQGLAKSVAKPIAHVDPDWRLEATQVGGLRTPSKADYSCYVQIPVAVTWYTKRFLSAAFVATGAIGAT